MSLLDDAIDTIPERPDPPLGRDLNRPGSDGARPDGPTLGSPDRGEPDAATPDHAL